MPPEEDAPTLLGVSRGWRVVLILLVLAAGAAAVAYPLFRHGYLRLNYPARSTYPMQGIDVSHHQGRIDWSRLPDQGVDFVYIKATEGGDFSDRRFEENWNAAVQVGVVPGAYHFFTFCRDGETQAAHFMAAIPKTPTQMPPAVDVEFGGNCVAGRPPLDEIRARLKRLLSLIESGTGRKPVVYLTMDAFRLLWRGHFPSYPLWIRNVFHTPWLPSGTKWTMWQFGNRGRLEGIEGPVDLNVFAGSNDAWRRFVASPVGEVRP